MTSEPFNDWVDISIMGSEYEVHLDVRSNKKRYRRRGLPYLNVRKDHTFDYLESGEEWTIGEPPHDK